MGAELNIVSAFEPVSKSRLASEQRDAPADVQYEIGPREDVNLTLEAAAAPARKEGVEVQTHPVQGDPSDAIITTAEKDRRRPGHRRQQRDDRGSPLPPRQRAQQHLPSRPLQRDDRPNHLGALQAAAQRTGRSRGRRRSGRRPARPRGRPRLRAVPSRRAATAPASFAPLSFGERTPEARTIAATPETWAAAIEVPT